MKTLRVLIPDAWPDRPEASWVLLNDDGRVDSEGTSDPRHWPEAGRTEAVLTGAQLSWHVVRMPRASVREQAKSLPFAVEEHLVREPDSQHCTPTDQGEESWAVLVIARERMRRLAAQFQTIRRPLDAVHAAAQTLPWEAGSWTIGVENGGIVVRTDEHAAFVDDVLSGDEVPGILATALEQAQAAGTAPQVLRVVQAGRNASEWTTQLNVPVELAGEWTWYRVPATAANLLQGEFSARHRTDAWVKRLKPAAILLVAVFLADLALGGLEVMLKQNTLNGMKSDMVRLFKSELPGTSLLDPVLQMRRELNTQRVRHGQLADDDPLVVLAALSGALGTDAANAVQSLRYEGSVLTVTLNQSGVDVDGLIQRLSARGVNAVRKDGGGIQLALRRSDT